jgi:hypothetical protein
MNSVTEAKLLRYSACLLIRYRPSGRTTLIRNVNMYCLLSQALGGRGWVCTLHPPVPKVGNTHTVSHAWSQIMCRWNISISPNGVRFTRTSLFINSAKGSSKSRKRQGRCVVKSEMCRSRSLESASVNSKRHTSRSVQTPFPHATPRLSDSLYSPAFPSFPTPSPYICHHISFTFLST